jgi:hypothetical protein
MDENKNLSYNYYFLSILLINAIFIFFYWFMLRKISNKTVLYFDNDCVGEKCFAKDCEDRNCKAGDCYGFGCISGVCHDKNCLPGECPEPNKQCTDGRKYKIQRPFYYPITKHWLKNTFVNPRLCKDLTVGDLREGRMMGLDIHSINTHENGTFLYQNIFNPKFKINDNEIVNYTIPMFHRDDNCKLCLKNKCEKEL